MASTLIAMASNLLAMIIIDHKFVKESWRERNVEPFDSPHLPEEPLSQNE